MMADGPTSSTALWLQHVDDSFWAYDALLASQLLAALA